MDIVDVFKIHSFFIIEDPTKVVEGYSLYDEEGKPVDTSLIQIEEGKNPVAEAIASGKKSFKIANGKTIIIQQEECAFSNRRIVESDADFKALYYREALYFKKYHHLSDDEYIKASIRSKTIALIEEHEKLPYKKRLHKPLELAYRFLKWLDRTDKKQASYSYLWLGKQDEDLPELYVLLVNSLIDPASTFEQLKAIFSKQPTSSFAPIRWHEENASEVLYFISRLTKNKLIESNEKRLDYKKLKACFIKPDGSKFTNNFKSLKQGNEFYLSIEKQQFINKLVDRFL